MEYFLHEHERRHLLSFGTILHFEITLGAPYSTFKDPQPTVSVMRWGGPQWQWWSIKRGIGRRLNSA